MIKNKISALQLGKSYDLLEWQSNDEIGALVYEYNKKVVYIGKADDDFNKNLEFKNFGKIKNDYIVLRGSVQGPVKRQLLITYPLRATKDQTKKKYEFLELR